MNIQFYCLFINKRSYVRYCFLIFRHKDTIHLVLIGFIGSGKSHTGNTIVRRKVFKSASGSVRITERVTKSQAPFSHVNFFVVDTPGLQKESDFDRLMCVIAKMELHNVFYAFVVRIGRISKEEVKLLDFLMKRNQKDLDGKTIVIFTNAKELVNDDNVAANQTFDAWLADSPTLKHVLGENNLQCVQFENTNASDEERKSYVNDLLMVLNIPAEKSSSVQVGKLIDFDSKQSDGEKESETAILVTKNQLLSKFGESGVMFFELEEKKQKKKHF